ncbi:hypothetical protein DFJ74DRAFT_336312 [Hyaloraphidium curvatum]|nr:hypothetical protein DFJ74DRAFT_336312 [Hyaloraphidium curvatum]
MDRRHTHRADRAEPVQRRRGRRRRRPGGAAGGLPRRAPALPRRLAPLPLPGAPGRAGRKHARRRRPRRRRAVRARRQAAPHPRLCRPRAVRRRRRTPWAGSRGASRCGTGRGGGRCLPGGWGSRRRCCPLWGRAGRCGSCGTRWSGGARGWWPGSTTNFRAPGGRWSGPARPCFAHTADSWNEDRRKRAEARAIRQYDMDAANAEAVERWDRSFADQLKAGARLDAERQLVAQKHAAPEQAAPQGQAPPAGGRKEEREKLQADYLKAAAEFDPNRVKH